MPVWQRTKPDDPDDTHCGWVFANDDGAPLNNPDPNFDAKTIREIYELVGHVGGKYAVPILFDKKLKTIVSNESADIIKILNSEFNDFAKNPGFDLAPEDMKSSMEDVDQWIYSTFNNGVYA